MFVVNALNISGGYIQQGGRRNTVITEELVMGSIVVLMLLLPCRVVVEGREGKGKLAADKQYEIRTLSSYWRAIDSTIQSARAPTTAKEAASSSYGPHSSL